jgi:hypothetical protein
MSKPIQDNGTFFPLNNTGSAMAPLRISKNSILECQIDLFFCDPHHQQKRQPRESQLPLARLHSSISQRVGRSGIVPILSCDPAAPRGSHDLAEAEPPKLQNIVNQTFRLLTRRSDRLGLGTELRLAPIPSINYANRCERQSKPLKLPADSFA